jgi:hypothetical protein
VTYSNKVRKICNFYIVDCKRGEVRGKWRRLRNEELYALYCSPHIIWVIISRQMRWAGHMAYMGERRRGTYGVLVRKPEGKRPLGRTRQSWEDCIKWIYSKWDGAAWTGLIWFRTGTGGELS